MARAAGVLEDDAVRIGDERDADRLHQRGAYGHRDGPDLVLGLHEAAYLVEEDRLDVSTPEGDPVSASGLIREGSRRDAAFETAFLVYREYRSRGYVIKEGEEELAAWARGASPPGQNPSRVLCPRSEASRATPEAMLSRIARSHGLGRGLVYGVVDEESDVTYYEADLATVTGNVQDAAENAGEDARVRVLRDRAVLEEQEGLGKAGYGHEVGGTVFCSLAEAWHLARHGALVVDATGDAVGEEEIEQRAGGRDARAAFGAYAWLRERGLVPKTGFKYGVHYRVYQDPPGTAHAPFLAQAFGPGASFTFREIARLVRLAHSVKKKPVLFSEEGAWMMQWTRP